MTTTVVGFIGMVAAIIAAGCWFILATSARLTSKSSQPDLFELSIETGQDQKAAVGDDDRYV